MPLLAPCSPSPPYGFHGNTSIGPGHNLLCVSYSPARWRWAVARDVSTDSVKKKSLVEVNSTVWCVTSTQGEYSDPLQYQTC